MRAAIARRMTESKREAPHFYISTEIEMDNAMALLARSNVRRDVRVTATAVLVHAAAVSLAWHPRVNSVWTSDGLLQADSINVGVAIALEDGLVAPAVLGADSLDLVDTASALADLVGRARGGKLKSAELNEGTFTLSNLGMFSVTSFAAIVTPPQVAILATGCTTPRVVPAGEGTRVASCMTATLSVDHRALDGSSAAAFLNSFKQALEEPAALHTEERRPRKEART